ncbi:MAG: hypothetical protein ACTSPV_17650, partial [Candidatus Hodarchaeales archaeon]
CPDCEKGRMHKDMTFPSLNAFTCNVCHSELYLSNKLLYKYLNKKTLPELKVATNISLKPQYKRPVSS